jgi:Uma2 family endonuclease
MAGTIPRSDSATLLVRLPGAIELDRRQFFELCRLNRELRIERTAKGDLEIMPPVAGGTSNQNARLTASLTAWALGDGSGEVFDSSGGFELPNGSVRSPDASWVRKERLAELTPEQWDRFLPLCPDFVVELRSPSDSVRELQGKMREYMENGAQLGWLLDPVGRRVHVYRPGAEPEILDDPAQVSAEPLLPGFVLNLRLIWGPRS